MKKKILILHGPNLNLLGEREPSLYGKMSLKVLNQHLVQATQSWNVQLKFFQKNGEGELIDLLHQQRKWADGIVFNPGAYTHYSYALRDAIASLSCPTVEVHLSDLMKRSKKEPFRKISVIAPVCVHKVMGYGWESYLKGIQFFLRASFRNSMES